MKVLTAPSHREAVLRCRQLGLAGVSHQAWSLRQKIAEVAAGASDPRVHEVHPEASFAAMNERPLQYGKKTWNGHQERRRILASVGISVPDEAGDLGRASVDDVLDAIAAAWSAGRIASGAARFLPEDAALGEPRIWY